MTEVPAGYQPYELGESTTSRKRAVNRWWRVAGLLNLIVGVPLTLYGGGVVAMGLLGNFNDGWGGVVIAIGVMLGLFGAVCVVVGVGCFLSSLWGAIAGLIVHGAGTAVFVASLDTGFSPFGLGPVVCLALCVIGMVHHFR